MNPQHVPVVSVITPTFNRGHLLSRAWQSLQHQNVPFEWIIVDDGSQDDTTIVVDSFADTRISLIAFPVNRGVNSARNAGVRRAHGQYVVFLDSDDELCSAALETAVTAFLTAPLDVGAVLMRAEIFGTRTPVSPLKHGVILDEHAIVCQGALHGDCGVMYRIEVFSFQMLPEDLRGCEQVFVYGIARRYKYLCIDIPFSIVHRQSDSLSHAASIIDRSRDIALSYERILSNHAAILRNDNHAAIGYAHKALYRYLIAGQYSAAFRVYRQICGRTIGLHAKVVMTLVGLAGLAFRCGPERVRLRYMVWRIQRPSRETVC
jgi:glycosyltransferase involved in cell wall biosynthesis